jgi:hypothetical protein
MFPHHDNAAAKYEKTAVAGMKNTLRYTKHIRNPMISLLDFFQIHGKRYPATRVQLHGASLMAFL